MQFSRTRFLCFLVGAILTLVACGQPRYVDPSLEPHVDSFERRYSIFFPGNVVLKDLPERVTGYCRMTLTGSWRLIEIDREFAENANHFELEETVYHEMGHCAMLLPHVDDKDQYGCPVSIMYPYAFGAWWCYNVDPEKYYKELEDRWKISSGKQ